MTAEMLDRAMDVDAALDGLPLRERLIVEMRMAGETSLSISEHVGLSPRTVRAVYADARARLRSSLSAYAPRGVA